MMISNPMIVTTITNSNFVRSKLAVSENGINSKNESRKNQSPDIAGISTIAVNCDKGVGRNFSNMAACNTDLT